ncbi:MAG: hypothetical protein NTZ49_02800 [Candidatus Parcubacteria bacterium]|nr:hypothetical protein [Candidatus Parcubacteria bacterium]
MPATEQERARIFNLQAKICMGILDGTFDAKKYAHVLQEFMGKKGGMVTLAQATEILGKKKVISAETAANAWQQAVSADICICFSEETLRQCAGENKTGDHDWRLIFIHSLSLYAMHKIRGTDPSNQPCFRKDEWWLRQPEEEWASFKPTAGYYLIDLQGQNNGMDWFAQEQEIAKLGPEYLRLHETIFIQIMFTAYMTNNGERIFQGGWHWGVALSYSGERIIVGDFVGMGPDISGNEGIPPYPYPGSPCGNGDLYVIIMRKPDC